jgi:hypothetical protein
VIKYISFPIGLDDELAAFYADIAEEENAATAAQTSNETLAQASVIAGEEIYENAERDENAESADENDGDDIGEEEEEDEEDDVEDMEPKTNADFADLSLMACMLCERQFASEEHLRRHQMLSELHQNNMKAYIERFEQERSRKLKDRDMKRKSKAKRFRQTEKRRRRREKAYGYVTKIQKEQGTKLLNLGAFSLTSFNKWLGYITPEQAKLIYAAQQKVQK